jgi:LAS superfamily LD-carboxypeptidase LdcB/pimeloyl-ACP methyl ester carboxylesterase
MNFVIFTQKNMKRLLKKICNKKLRYLIYPLFFILSAYLITIIFAERIETSLIFPWLKAEKIGGKAPFDFEEINISLGKEKNINWIFIDKKSEKTIFYFHGNGGDFSYYYDDINLLQSLGYNVMAFDYPWFWKSSGSPDRKTMKQYQEIFFNFIKKEKKIDEKNIILLGYSIGTGIALDFAQNHIVEKIILLAPFSSLFDMSQKQYEHILQKYLFLPERFNSKEIVKTLNIPILILHGNKDANIPIEQGKLVFRNAFFEKNYFLEIDGVGHSNILKKYKATVKWFLKIFLEKWKLESHYYFIDKNTQIPQEKKEEPQKDPLEILKKLDYKTDTSFTKYVWVWISFHQKEYIPKNLVSVRDFYISDGKWWQVIQKEVRDALNELGKVFFEKFWKKISVVSWYRSSFYQEQIKANGCPDTLCSNPWYSEHQSGLAVDLWETTTEKEFLSKENLKNYFSWLQENAYLYGFHNSYQNGSEIDGYQKEPWHWRYLGKELASYLYEEKISFSQFYKKINNK